MSDGSIQDDTWQGEVVPMKETLKKWADDLANQPDYERTQTPVPLDQEDEDDTFQPYAGFLPSRTQIDHVLDLMGVTGPTKKKAKQQRTAVLVSMFEENTYRRLKGKLKRRNARLVARKSRRINRLRSK